MGKIIAKIIQKKFKKVRDEYILASCGSEKKIGGGRLCFSDQYIGPWPDTQRVFNFMCTNSRISFPQAMLYCSPVHPKTSCLFRDRYYWQQLSVFSQNKGFFLIGPYLFHSTSNKISCLVFFRPKCMNNHNFEDFFSIYVFFFTEQSPVVSSPR